MFNPECCCIFAYMLISLKCGHFMLDNASNNAKFMQELEPLLLAQDVAIGCDLFRAFRSSGECRDAFEQSIREGNEKKCF